jgi:hypothetical protein
MFDAQAKSLADLAASQAASIARLEERIDSTESLRTLRFNTPPPLTTTAIQLTTDTVRKPKLCLLHPEKFDGNELSFFLQFEGLLRAKLEIDREAIRQEKEKV